MKSLSLVALTFSLAVSFAGTGCAHTVRIDSAPGADIYVDGQHVGQSPATFVETSGGSGTVLVTAKKNGKESTLAVPKSSVDWGAVGAGTVVGAGACCAISSMSFVAALVFWPCAAVGMLGWGALAAGPLGGFVWYGHKMPDHVHVPLEDSAPAVAMSDEVIDRRFSRANY